MRSLSLEEVAEATGGSPAGEWARLSINRVGTDTRALRSGDLFFALKGPNHDANGFLDDAMRRGAKAAVVSSKSPLAADFHSRNPEFPLVMVKDTLKALGDLAARVRRSLDIEAVGITGTTGKTCTKDMLVSILSRDKGVAGSEGSFNNEVGVPLTVFGIRKKDSVLVAEMGARRTGEIRRLAGVVLPRVGIITNVGPGHLELFKTEETVADTKAELARCLPEGGNLLLNAADPWTRKIARQTRARVTMFGVGRGSAYRAYGVKTDEDARPSFTIRGPGLEVDVRLNAVGRHQVENALAAASCAHLMGAGVAAIKVGLEKARLSAWRTERTVCAGGFTVINDAYNANPRSMAAALDTLAEASGARRSVAVLGGMAELGSRSVDFHREMGVKAAELDIDLLVTVGRRARAIATGAIEGGLPRGSVFRCDDVAGALDVLSCLLEPEDVVLVKASRAMGLEALPERIASPAFVQGRLVTDV